MTLRLAIGSCLVLCIGWVGCAGPAERYDSVAAERGLERGTVAAGDFELAVFGRQLAAPGRRLHVYLEGDGTPWRSGRPARDPTPRSAVALRLLASDPQPAVLLGRPCYHGRSSAQCRTTLWTFGRYSDRVVEAMASALRQIEARELVLIGHSGGGSLAMLLAPRVPNVVGVVTLGANLDLRAWTRHHGDEALTASVDPARQPPLAPEILQIHLAGERDAVVPPAITRRVAGDRLRVIPEADHVCCWADAWPAVLGELDERLGPAGARSPK